MVLNTNDDCPKKRPRKSVGGKKLTTSQKKPKGDTNILDSLFKASELYVPPSLATYSEEKKKIASRINDKPANYSLSDFVQPECSSDGTGEICCNRKNRRKTIFIPETMDESRLEFLNKATKLKVPNSPKCEKTKSNFLDRTMYDPEKAMISDDEDIDNIDWSQEFSDFDVIAHLKKKPGKSCIRRKSRSALLHPIDTYKFVDEEQNLIVVIGGLSSGTYFKRIIMYLANLKNSMEKVMNQFLFPKVNFQENLFANLQTIEALFHEELIPMLTYSVFNKNNNFLEELMNQFQLTIPYFLQISSLNGKSYTFKEPKKHYLFDDDDNEGCEYVNSLPRTLSAKFAENFYLVISVMLYGIFKRNIHFSVLVEMLKLFAVGLRDPESFDE